MLSNKSFYLYFFTADGHKLIFKTENLKTSEIMERLDSFCKAKDTSQPDADMELTKMSGKMKKKK